MANTNVIAIDRTARTIAKLDQEQREAKTHVVNALDHIRMALDLCDYGSKRWQELGGVYLLLNSVDMGGGR